MSLRLPGYFTNTRKHGGCRRQQPTHGGKSREQRPSHISSTHLWTRSWMRTTRRLAGFGRRVFLCRRLRTALQACLSAPGQLLDVTLQDIFTCHGYTTFHHCCDKPNEKKKKKQAEKTYFQVPRLTSCLLPPHLVKLIFKFQICQHWTLNNQLSEIFCFYPTSVQT